MKHTEWRHTVWNRDIQNGEDTETHRMEEIQTHTEWNRDTQNGAETVWELANIWSLHSSVQQKKGSS